MTPLHKKILEKAYGGFWSDDFLPIISGLLEANQRLTEALEDECRCKADYIYGATVQTVCDACEVLTANADLLERIAGGGE